nr:hypothetical protein SHINE37_110040 [Rhizobiaceae bacterium]
MPCPSLKQDFYTHVSVWRNKELAAIFRRGNITASHFLKAGALIRPFTHSARTANSLFIIRAIVTAAGQSSLSKIDRRFDDRHRRLDVMPRGTFSFVFVSIDERFENASMLEICLPNLGFGKQDRHPQHPVVKLCPLMELSKKGVLRCGDNLLVKPRIEAVQFAARQCFTRLHRLDQLGKRIQLVLLGVTRSQPCRGRFDCGAAFENGAHLAAIDRFDDPTPFTAEKAFPLKQQQCFAHGRPPDAQPLTEIVFDEPLPGLQFRAENHAAQAIAYIRCDEFAGGGLS